jgi:prefoldin subunit 5
MEGRAGNGRGGRYSYYCCRNRNCNLRVAAPEIEGIVLDRLRLLATSDGLLDKLVAATNQRLNRQLPALQKRKRALGRELSDVKGQIDRLLSALAGFDTQAGRSSVAAKLGELEERRSAIETSIDHVDESLRHVQGAALSADAVREALAHITEIYAHLKPLEQKELFPCWSSERKSARGGFV